jgi:hypothetical protein
MTERHRRAAGAFLRPGIDLVLLIGEPRERPVQPVRRGIEPVAAENPGRDVGSVRVAGFGATGCAERERAMYVAEIEIACA